jgi:hypothetical protein
MPPTTRKAEATPVAKAERRDITEVQDDDPTLRAARASVGDSLDASVSRSSQFPSLIGANGVEVAQRTIDREHLDADPTASSSTYRKVFVLLNREWQEHTDDQKADVHTRNIRAVRQFMVGNGLRPTGDVKFVGEEVVKRPQTGHLSNDSVELTYEGGVTPIAAVVTDKGATVADGAPIEQLHTVVPQDGASAQEQADYEASSEERVRAGHLARVGDVPGPKPSLTATA